MPTLTPVDESFFETAPQRFSRSWEIARSADSVWSELTGERPLHWCTGLDIRWTTPAPFGVGTTRTARVLGLVVMQEQYFRWEEGRRKTFHGTRMNLPLFESLAEDYVVEPLGTDRSRFTWTIAIKPSRLGAAGGPLNSLIFSLAFRDTGKHFGAA